MKPLLAMLETSLHTNAMSYSLMEREPAITKRDVKKEGPKPSGILKLASPFKS